MGIMTNIYIAGLIVYFNLFEVLLSPIIGTIIFITCLYLLTKNHLSSKFTFLIVAYTVLIEIGIHSYYLGWDCGFYYFTFLLPTVFLLNPSWKTWDIISFNASILISAVLLRITLHQSKGITELDPELTAFINLTNISGTASIVIIIMIYFSRTVNQKDQELIEANVALGIQNKEILEQRNNLQLLIKEIHHRVKNNLQIISSLMSLQERVVEDKEISAILNESKRRIEAIALIHQKLYQNQDVYQVDFESYLSEIMSSQQIMNTRINCVLKTEKIMLDLDTAVPLGLIISELVTNSVKHAFLNIDNPTLTIQLIKKENHCELIIEDNGIGLPSEFDIHKTESLGFEIIEALAEQIEAKIEYKNNPGAMFLIQFNKTEI